MTLLPRPRQVATITDLLSQFPVVGIVGARQVGKSTLARIIAGDKMWGAVTFFDLEDPRDRARLDDPMLALEPLRGLVILDEIQQLPGVFTVLRVLADRAGSPARFLVLGSAGPDLLRQGSESLAGRIAYQDLGGLALDEVDAERYPDLWVRGGFPRSFLADSDAHSARWRREFVRNFTERDLPRLGIGVPAETMRRFWTMLAHGHGQTLNASSIARSFAISDVTVRRYLDALSSALVVRQLRPWHENLRKRQVRAPKVYVADTGLLHTLLGLDSREALEGHPQVGASWEAFAISNVLDRLGARWGEDAYFWRTHAGAEIDLIVIRQSRRLGFEVKRTVAPALTPSMRIALDDLKLDRIDVLHAGRETFRLAERVRAVSTYRIWADLSPL
ncbi:MAG: ATP-binding protein [Gemmatimonadetes bacterium]|nr:ATP-binding protein [Gemmatimonadota bacterium]MBI2402784.1 ATP-binding protein [Gemmatimonadota bacterium]